LLAAHARPEVALILLYRLLPPDLKLDLRAEFLLGGFLGILPALPPDGYTVCPPLRVGSVLGRCMDGTGALPAVRQDCSAGLA
jgi:hypothetical protein